MGARDLLYRVYERQLASELAGGPMPRHVGVIIDGNRVTPRSAGLGTASHGHEAGARHIDPSSTGAWSSASRT
jgi:short-chain Z-isoprenyl diphosphate synthase